MVGSERGFFSATRPAQRQAAKGARTRWADIFATLTAAGHDARSLTGYTQRQLMLFYDAALRKERRDRRARVTDMAAAHVGGKAATDYIAHLKD